MCPMKQLHTKTYIMKWLTVLFQSKTQWGIQYFCVSEKEASFYLTELEILCNGY